MIHYLYVGHFARQGDFIQFEKQADGSLRPVVQRPLSMTTVQHVLKQRGLTGVSFPEEWGLWLDDGFLVCDRFTHSREAIEIVRCLAAEAGCEIADYSSQSLICPKELIFGWGPQVRAEKGTNQANRAERIASTDRPLD